MEMELKKIVGFDICDCGPMDHDSALKQPELANAAQIGGYSDWVFPDTQTLRALAILDSSTDVYWSSSPYMGSSSYSWSINFVNGYVGYGDRDYGLQVRLVRASQCLNIGRAGQLKSMEEAGIKWQA